MRAEGWSWVEILQRVSSDELHTFQRARRSHWEPIMAEAQRIEANEAMASAFEQVDFIVAATNPGPAFAADAAMSNPQESFIDWAKSNGAAKVALKSALGAVRVIDPDRDPLFLKNRPSVPVPPLAPGLPPRTDTPLPNARRIRHLLVLEGGRQP